MGGCVDFWESEVIKVILWSLAIVLALPAFYANVFNHLFSPIHAFAVLMMLVVSFFIILILIFERK